LAFTKEHKSDMLGLYQQWIKGSQAIIMLEYKGMTMKDIDALRSKVRDAGGEIHIVKNTLFNRAIDETGMPSAEKVLEGTTAVTFAFKDPAAMAKVIHDATVKSEIFKVKGGYLSDQVVTASELKSLAELPPLPVMRARLLGMLQAPASQLVRTLAEPARSMAAVVRAYSEKDAAPAAA
jgi:large subunit ribosomal protein L10